MINLTNIQTITDYCIRLLTTTEKLRRYDSTKEAYKHADELFPSLRKLFVASLMQNKQLICVSGLQGAGKTTLMKNFYGIKDEFLNVSIGRGERVPVLITESDVAEPHISAIVIDKDTDGNYSKKEEALSNEEIINATKGEDQRIMYLEITVPYKHTFNKGVSFMLLPGFEKKNEYWNDLIEFSVNSSDAAVFVFNETSFSNAENETYLNRIEKRFGQNVVFAITGSDGSLDDNAQVKQTCLDVLKVKAADRVVCVGQYNDTKKNEAWIKAFKSAIDKYALFETNPSQKNIEYINNELLNIKDTLYNVLNILNEGDDTAHCDYKNHSLLKAYDAEMQKKRKELAKNIQAEFAQAKEASAKYVADELQSKPWYKKIKKSIFGTNIKEQYIETQELIKDSLKPNGKSLPDYHLGKAIESSLRLLDTPVENNPNSLQLLVDTTEQEGNIILLESEETKNALGDVRTLLEIPQKGGKSAPLQHTDTKQVLKAVAEVATYFYGMKSYDLIAQSTPSLDSYVPAEAHLKAQNVIDGANDSKKFAVGLAGVMGVDVLADGSLNFISQIATSCSVAIPYAAAAAVLIVGTGAAIAIIKDVNQMQRADFESAKMAINCIYDNLQQESLDRFDFFTAEVRERIEDRLTDLDGSKKSLMYIYNAKVEVNNLIDLLDNLTGEYQRQVHVIGSNF